MKRRPLLSLPAWPLVAPFAAARAAAPSGVPMRTQWTFRTSAGLEAIAFLGPLSGKPFYARHYAKELAAFKPRLARPVNDAIDHLFHVADAGGRLLWPWVALVASGGDTGTIEAVLGNLADDAAALEEPYRRAGARATRASTSSPRRCTVCSRPTASSVKAGDIEAWLGRAADGGRLAPARLHAAAAAVRGQSVEQLWTGPARAPDRPRR
jgi:hypothetical protein